MVGGNDYKRGPMDQIHGKFPPGKPVHEVDHGAKATDARQEIEPNCSLGEMAVPHSPMLYMAS
jgi:hypothetical protein